MISSSADATAVEKSAYVIAVSGGFSPKPSDPSLEMEFRYHPGLPVGYGLAIVRQWDTIPHFSLIGLLALDLPLLKFISRSQSSIRHTLGLGFNHQDRGGPTHLLFRLGVEKGFSLTDRLQLSPFLRFDLIDNRHDEFSWGLSFSWWWLSTSKDVYPGPSIQLKGK